jgi:hypothetical protein
VDFALGTQLPQNALAKKTATKPACKVPVCKGQHAESFHEMMLSAELAVNSVIYEEDEGYVNIARGDHGQEDGNGWRAPNNSWLDMEEEEGVQVYHVNVILEEDDNEERMEEESGEEEEAEPKEKKRGSDRSRCEARRRRPKRRRVCKEGVDWEKLKLDGEIRDLLSNDTSKDDLEQSEELSACEVIEPFISKTGEKGKEPT